MKKRKPKSKEVNKPTYLLIDGEGLLHQSFHKFANLKSQNGEPTGAIFGFFKSLHHYLYRFKPNDVYIVFDNGHSTERTKILPTYKEHRKRIDMDYTSLQSQKKNIMKLLRMLKIKYIYDKHKTCNYEGDDFLAYLSLKYLPRKARYILVTADKDFNQLLRGQSIKIFNPRKDQLVFESNCKEIFGYKASETVDYLTLIGDKSDDIPGYIGIGEKKAKAFLEKYGSIQNYLSSDEYLRDDPDHQKMKEVYSRNKVLIDLKWFVNNIPIKKLPIKCYNDREIPSSKYEKFCNRYSLSSFLGYIFLGTFKEQIDRSWIIRNTLC